MVGWKTIKAIDNYHVKKADIRVCAETLINVFSTGKKGF